MDKNIPWDLILAKLKGTITADGNHQLDDWLSREANQKLYDELYLLWTNVQKEASDYTPDTNHYWQELSSRINVKPEKKKQIRTIPLKTIQRYAVAACFVLVAALSFTFYLGSNSGNKDIATQCYSNMSGKSKVYLPDGTEVWLHSNTMIAYKTDFKAEKREVKVKGEAFFNVTHNKDLPFIVQTNGMSITVHGTKFNVASLESSENAYVSLLEGSVSLKTSKHELFLKPGEMATYNKRHKSLLVEKADVEYEKSWADDQIYFDQKSLGYICRYLSKWYDVRIDLDPAIAEKYAYTFTLRNEPLEEILRIMSRINPINYQFSENNMLTIKK